MQFINKNLRQTMLALASAIALAGCGGGGTSSTATNPLPVTAGTTSAVYAGPIGGFGSVICNGTRFSSVGAVLVDDDTNSVTLDQLKLGMTVRISGDADDATQLGTATRLELVHGNRGQITAIDISAGTLVVLGQRVVTNNATAYQGTTGLSSLTVGQPVEVYGALQADGSVLATLIEVKTALPSVNLNGRISGLTSTSFQVGTLTVNFGSATVTGNLADGKRVKVRATTGPVNNVLTASSVKVSESTEVFGSNVTTGVKLKLKGVAEAAPVNGLLTVSGTPVNITKATIKGSVGVIAAGQFIEVKGIWDGSVLQATEVEQEGYRESQIGGRNELYGAVSSISGNIAVVNGVIVDLSNAIFEHGNLALVAVGSYVEIKGNLNGNKLVPTKVELKTNITAQGKTYEQSGRIQGYTSVAGFMLNGLQVDASQAVFERGTASDLANGVYVEIKGVQISSGIFFATKVEIKTGSAS